MNNTIRTGVLALASLCLVAPVMSSPPPPSAHTAPEVVGGGSPSVGVVRLEDPNSPEQRATAARNRDLAQVEKELKQIRAKYFRATRNTEIRQVGIAKLGQYDAPSAFPLLIELFKDEDEDARRAVLDHLTSLNNDAADATIAWSAVFDKSKGLRAELAKRVAKRAERGEVSNRIKSVVAIGLRSKGDDTVAAAANLANILKLYEAIPMLINAQTVGGGPGTGAGDNDRSLAYILVGSQVAFVSDLQPVVGDSAVAFDPTVGVATEGVILRVIDAYVITYRVEVHNSLVDLSSDGWDGRSTSGLGWDNAKWREWYTKEFLPFRENAGTGKTDTTP